MIYQVLTAQYFDQAKQLIIKQFSNNSIIHKFLQIPLHQIRQDKQKNLKFRPNSGVIAVDSITNNVVAVTLIKQFLQFAKQILSGQHLKSQGLQFMRHNAKQIVVDVLKKYPNIKKGEISYDHSGCVHSDYINRRIMILLSKFFDQFKIKMGYKYSIGITVDSKVLRMKHNQPSQNLKITEYEYKNTFKGRLFLLKDRLFKEFQSNNLCQNYDDNGSNINKCIQINYKFQSKSLRNKFC